MGASVGVDGVVTSSTPHQVSTRHEQTVVVPGAGSGGSAGDIGVSGVVQDRNILQLNILSSGVVIWYSLLVGYLEPLYICFKVDLISFEGCNLVLELKNFSFIFIDLLLVLRFLIFELGWFHHGDLWLSLHIVDLWLHILASFLVLPCHVHHSRVIDEFWINLLLLEAKEVCLLHTGGLLVPHTLILWVLIEL